MNTLSLTLPFGRFGTGLGHAAQTLLARWEQARRYRQTQRYLAEMDDHMLSDIGVSRAQAMFELEHTVRRRSHS
jgi:uncharacterized protein YjiS (DUF1127 family)